MRAKTKKHISALILCTGVVGLGGCLTDEESTASAVDESPGVSINKPPTISGAPPAGASINKPYSFTPTASDPDGDTLVFAVENKPVWATFDTNTGNLAGVPSLADIGTFVNVVISVSDGQTSASLSKFSISVTQASLGSATLSWNPPTQNTDGSAISNLAGYRIYYGDEPGNYQTMIQLDNPGLSTYVVENLAPDTYYFASTAFRADGVESLYSSEAVKSVE